jgi:hypothetical protein
VIRPSTAANALCAVFIAWFHFKFGQNWTSEIFHFTPDSA